MRNYVLKIAGYTIGFEAAAGGPDLVVSPKFLRYTCTDTLQDICINIHSGTFDMPEGAERVFHAPFMEEINGILINNNPEFWSIWQHDTVLYIKTTLPLSDSQKSAVLRFALTEKKWDLWLEPDKNEIDPFEYPLDGLILYYVTVINNDIMIHASGIRYKEKGFLFTGVSGKGKSTMAELWNNHEAEVIHDDRLIIRKSGSGYMMFNTPVYNNDEPLSSTLDRIFIIEHGNENEIIPLREASAVSKVLANCIQHSWGKAIISMQLDSVREICSRVPACLLFFKPDPGIIDYILNTDEQP